MERIFIKPAKPDSCPRFPENPKRKLKPEGEEVDYTTHWARRLRTGEVVLVEQAKAPRKPAPVIGKDKEASAGDK